MLKERVGVASMQCLNKRSKKTQKYTVEKDKTSGKVLRYVVVAINEE